MKPAITIILALSFSHCPAHASPWGQEDGAIYARVAWADEEVQSVGATRADLYSELGLGGGYTATVKIEQVDYDGGAKFDSFAWRATLQRRLFRKAGFVGAAEVGAVRGAAIGGRRGCDQLGVELRTGLGWSGQVASTASFSFAQLATRQHDACYRNRYEFGVGQHIFGRFWLVSQYWIERGSDDATSDKVQSDLVWRGKTADIALSYREEISGLFEESGIVLSVAAKY